MKALQQEKFRSIIVHHDRPEVLIAFLKKACQGVDGKWLNLLEHFKNAPELTQQLDYFNVHKLKGLLIEESKGKEFLFIVQADFLLDTYDHRELGHFFRLLDKQWNNFLQNTACTLVFGLISSDDIEGQKMTTSSGASRIIALSELNSLG
ncbi:MAG: hypothetical protein H6620_11655 [Halobacteriovoraceae bacterium]|nr:hypothetical protein [Halobacteriovoraceae bacterium]